MRAKEELKMIGEKIRKEVEKNIGCSIHLAEVIKTNETYYIGLQKIDGAICPTLYINKFIDDYNQGNKSMNTIVKEICDAFDHNVSPNLNMDFIKDYKKVKGLLSMALCSEFKNPSIVRDIVGFTLADDLYAYVIIRLNEKDFGINGCIKVTYNLWEKWNIGELAIIEDARWNIPNIDGVHLIPMLDLIFELKGNSVKRDKISLDIREHEPVYVLTNASRSLGASVIACDTIMHSIWERIGDFAIIPSSIHEVLVVPKNEMDIDTASLTKMLIDVNTQEVALDEILSENVYEYTEDGLSLAE